MVTKTTGYIALLLALLTACAGQPSTAPDITRVGSPVTDAPGAACSSEILLPIMKDLFDDPSIGLIIERVDIQRCRNGYAHLFAVPSVNPEGEPQYDSEQLFLRYKSGSWHVVAQGTGIGCSDPDVTEELASACRALGYL